MELKFGVSTILYKYSDLTKFEKIWRGHVLSLVDFVVFILIMLFVVILIFVVILTSCSVTAIKIARDTCMVQFYQL